MVAMLNIKYILSDLFKSENSHICEELSKDKDRVYCVVKRQGIAYVAIPPAKAIELGLIKDDAVPVSSRTHSFNSKTIKVKKIKTQGLGYGLGG
jgi:hypothetical protein